MLLLSVLQSSTINPSFCFVCECHASKEINYMIQEKRDSLCLILTHSFNSFLIQNNETFLTINHKEATLINIYVAQFCDILYVVVSYYIQLVKIKDDTQTSKCVDIVH